jgi:hypothetical protein
MSDDRASNAPTAHSGEKKSNPPGSRPAEKGSSVPPGVEHSAAHSSHAPLRANMPTLIGIQAPSTPAPSTPAPSVPTASAPVKTSSTFALGPKPLSIPPTTLDHEEESWDEAFEAASSQASIPIEAPASKPKSTPPVARSTTAAPKAQPSTVATSAEPVGAPEEPRASLSETQRSPSGRFRVAVLMIAAVVIGGAWFLLRSRSESPIKLSPNAPVAAPGPEKPEVTPLELSKRAPTPAPSVEVATQASGSASPAPAAPPEDTAAVPSSSSGDLIVVTVTTIPADARFFHKGKPVGRSPLRVELKPGERRSFEIGHPGYFARKVVVDGTQKDMTVAMRPES